MPAATGTGVTIRIIRNIIELDVKLEITYQEGDFSSLRYHRLIQVHVVLLEEEALRGPFLGPCQWPGTRGHSAAAVSHQLAIAIAINSTNTTVAVSLPMVCT